MYQSYYKKHPVLTAILLPAWVFFGYYTANIIVGLILLVVNSYVVDINSLNQTVLNAFMALLVYAFSIAIIIYFPWKLKNIGTTWQDIGLNTLPKWRDIFIVPAGLAAYFFLAAAITVFMVSIFPWIDVNESQNVGFNILNNQFEYILAFITLVIVAPVAEEVLFRGYLYDKLQQFTPVWAAVVITSLLFGYIHGAWNIAISTFALSIVLCALRNMTGSLWSPILLHMLKNAVAFYFLFINTSVFAIIM